MSRNSKTSKRNSVRVRGGTVGAVARAYTRYLDIIQKLPGTEESTSYGTPAIKVKGKLLSRLRTEAEGAHRVAMRFLGSTDSSASGSGSVFPNGSLPKLPLDSCRCQ